MKLIVDIVSSFHPILFKGKKVKRTWENDKKPPDSHPIFAHLSRICAPNLCVCVCVWERVFPLIYLGIIASYHCMQFQGKSVIQTQQNGEKPHSRSGASSGRQIFFSKIWLSQSLDIKVSYHHIEYQKKK